MPSPFPGMDPYLEDPAFWRDFHGRFIYAVSELLLERLPPRYDAAVDEHLRLIEAEPGNEFAKSRRGVLPDVSVIRHGFETRSSVQASPSSTAPSASTVEPVLMRVPLPMEDRDRWIEITNRDDGSLVTAIEVLSPTNKAGDGFGEYRTKRQALLRQRVNLVELDLLIGGQRVETGPDLPAGDYYALVSRAERPAERAAYAWNVRHALPSIPIPLRPPDGDVSLDLAAALGLSYDRGRYARRLRYDRPLSAPLTPADREWAEVVARSLRPLEH